MDLRQSSWLSILPFLMMAIGTNASGWVADTLINSKVWASVGEHRDTLVLQSASTKPLASELMHTKDWQLEILLRCLGLLAASPPTLMVCAMTTSPITDASVRPLLQAIAYWPGNSRHQHCCSPNRCLQQTPPCPLFFEPHPDASQVMSPTKTRKLLQTIGNVGPGTCLMYLALVPQKGFLAEAVALLTVSMMTLGMQAGGFAATHTVRGRVGQEDERQGVVSSRWWKSRGMECMG